ncbi:NAD(P)-dependent dehydrogenase (short-subunit alcohol dehydrogenase family) [Alicyclobacillus sacchari]|uniref:NAD(P)-dependent dehydrogenase (Short-subunit alcohol dehydrogenase family) n=1 Tax=Alicyclobacillus sacchari TaxID=392010 RepID=A0A4R8LJJ2_9BACL|nr:SDR family oxidoreductase [Alicyclobacillus sacchari]TDY42421.1 NAD(P)-dependent dehydrogenase (short-subunit alcohol dehydrogenase family) [Alicyclobacillus sacchari]GMA57367.1 2-deoxy-D-gluconate 3-dehydrogenase [Alicyclobacillus sacchari]
MESLNFRLDGKIALVTGASRGIGRGLARHLAAAGATVIAAGRDANALESLASEGGDRAGVIEPLLLDVRSVANIRRAFSVIDGKYGRLDVLVNNAGLGYNHDAIDVTEEDWDEMMAVNMKGVFFCSQEAAKLMMRQNKGRIIQMSSQAGIVGIERHAVYSASKGGVNMLTKVLALEWAPHGITVNAIAPTFIYTPGTAERLDQPEFRESVVSRIPVARVGTIEDVAGAVLYLASDAAGLVNGTVLVVDGGWTAR